MLHRFNCFTGETRSVPGLPKPMKWRLAKTKKLFTLHAGPSLVQLFFHTLAFPPPFAHEAICLILGRLQAYLTCGRQQQAFLAFADWTVKAVPGTLWAREQDKDAEQDWSRAFHLVVLPALDHKLPAGRYQHLSFKGAAGLPHIKEARQLRSTDEFNVVSMQRVTRNNPLLLATGLQHDDQTYWPFHDSWSERDAPAGLPKDEATYFTWSSSIAKAVLPSLPRRNPGSYEFFAPLKLSLAASETTPSLQALDVVFTTTQQFPSDAAASPAALHGEYITAEAFQSNYSDGSPPPASSAGEDSEGGDAAARDFPRYFGGTVVMTV
ncbi:hypothetical protein JCM10213_004741 [Rhodosporidiobolus nylandii]